MPPTDFTVLHPRAALRQRHRERGEHQEQDAHAERVDEQQRAAAERRRAVVATNVSRPSEERAGARRGDEAADEAHRERAAEALAADLVELGLPARRQVADRTRRTSTPRARRTAATSGNTTHGLASCVPKLAGLADQRERDAERPRRSGPCRRRRRSRAAIARLRETSLAARAEDRERDRDHRVDARRQRRQEAEPERGRGTSSSQPLSWYSSNAPSSAQRERGRPARRAATSQGSGRRRTAATIDRSSQASAFHFATRASV